MEVDIVDLDDDLEAVALRSVLECFDFTVRMHYVATSGQLVRTLGDEDATSGNVVLMCHGGEEGLLLPELAGEVAAEQPYAGVMTAADFRSFLRLPGRLVINTGCLLGRQEYADAFLDAGCRSYVGPIDYVEAYASLFYVLHFLYGLRRGGSVDEAHEQARAHGPETASFQLYRNRLAK